MSNVRDFVLTMYNQMDEDFKKQNQRYIDDLFSMFPCIYLMKDDLIGYAKEHFNKNEKELEKIIEHINNLDDCDMQHIAQKYMVTDPLMDSFWLAVECWINKIRCDISIEDDEE